MSQIGHTEPGVRFSDGTAYLYDLNIAAALLSRSGAAWDGKTVPVDEPDGTDRTAWRQSLELPDVRQVHVELVGHSLGVVDETVTRKDGWTDPKTGVHYEPGKLAPMRRVCYHLRGEYRYRTGGAVTRRVPWTGDDFKFWFGQWFKRGGFLSGAKMHMDKRAELLDLNRREYGIMSQLKTGV